MHDSAVVVGSGPNGLAAAITLAGAGLHVTVLEGADTIGGGTRTEELTLPGYLHDVCSAFHPLGVASPFFAGLPLSDFGLEWRVPEVQVAHPLDDGTAGAVYQSVDRTAASLGDDGAVWARDIGGVAARWDALSSTLLGPLIRVPSYPLRLAWFGTRALWPATTYLQRRFDSPTARALFAGIAGHSILPLNRPFTASFGLLLGGLAHVAGWPVAVGGSSSITNAMRAYLESLGGEVLTRHAVESRSDLPAAAITIFDTTPTTVAAVYGDEVPGRVARRYRRFRPGPGAFKIDVATSQPIPWVGAEPRLAGTVHVGGTWEEIARAEAQVWRGEHPDTPFVLVGQQSVADPTRAPDGGDTVWAYCHVPSGSTEDMTDRIIDQIERFATGFRATIRLVRVMDSAALEARNPNYVGGDISGGAHDGFQLLMRGGTNPYRTGVAGVYLCSSSTPPGAGVHGMCGWHAARQALSDLRGGT
ncbi:MAG: NAD(P)/FAD-dependent oxidoreductase [Acidimicrobiia bacterium]|nr:NAD(P)/FAD-dependent oxidoreductase [Acidimicrobiia bacterium]